MPSEDITPMTFVEASERYGICASVLRRAVKQGLLAVFYAHESARPKLLPVEMDRYIARQTRTLPQAANYTNKNTDYSRARNRRKGAEIPPLPLYRGGVGR